MHSTWIQRKINDLNKQMILLKRYPKNKLKLQKLETEKEKLENEKLIQLKIQWAKKYGKEFVNIYEKIENYKINFGDPLSKMFEVNKLFYKLNMLKADYNTKNKKNK